MANLGSCYIKSCCVTTLRSVNSGIYICVCVCTRVCMRANVIACLGNTPARLGPAVSLDLISHSDELLCGTGAYGLKKKKSSSFLCATVLQKAHIPSALPGKLFLLLLTHSTLPLSVSVASSVMALAVFII